MHAMRVRTIGLTALVALGIVAGVTSSARAERGDGLQWRAPLGRTLTQRMVISDSEPGNYWGTQWFFSADQPGNGGYIGVQSEGGVNQIFTIWGATDVRDADGTCELNTEMENGAGGQCISNNGWRLGEEIVVRVHREGAGRGPDEIESSTKVEGTWWSGTIRTGSTTTELGSFFLPGTRHRLDLTGNFNEAFIPRTSNLPGCLHSPYSTKVTWWAPVVTDDAGTATTAWRHPFDQVVPCPASSPDVDDGVVVDRGPHVLPAATGSNAKLVGIDGRLYVEGSVDIDFGANAVGVISTVNGSPTPYKAESTAVAGPRRYRVLAAKKPGTRAGATFCALAENGPRSKLGCLEVLSGSVGRSATSMTGADGTGTIAGTVTRGGTGIATRVRTRFRSHAGTEVGTPVMSGSDGAFAAPFSDAPRGAVICVDADEHGVWVAIGCRAINSGSVSTVPTLGGMAGTVDNPLFDGPIMVRAYIDGEYYSAAYSDPGPGPRSFTVPVRSGGRRVCVTADSYGHIVHLGCSMTPA